MTWTRYGGDGIGLGVGSMSPRVPVERNANYASSISGDGEDWMKANYNTEIRQHGIMQSIFKMRPNCAEVLVVLVEC